MSGYLGFKKRIEQIKGIGINYELDLMILKTFLLDYQKSYNYHVFAKKWLKEQYKRNYNEIDIKLPPINKSVLNRGLTSSNKEQLTNCLLECKNTTSWGAFLERIIKIGIYTGFRLGELCSIDWNNPRIIDNNGEMSEILYIVEKTHKENTKPILNDDIEFLKSSLIMSKSFETKYKYIQNLFTKFRNMYDIKFSFHFHTLRHTNANDALDNDITAEQIAHYQGSTPQTIMRNYYDSANSKFKIAQTILNVNENNGLSIFTNFNRKELN